MTDPADPTPSLPVTTHSAPSSSAPQRPDPWEAARRLLHDVAALTLAERSLWRHPLM